MHILMANDDGIEAAGLRDLAKALSRKHRITVVAPMFEQSGKSHALTTDRPLQVKKYPKERNIDWIAIDGTPTDCVKWALSYGLCQDMPDLLISGVNNGYNLGSDALYSGTVGAAMEGCFYGVPSLALSVAAYSRACGQAILPIVEELLDRLYSGKEGAFTPSLLNVNFPPHESYSWSQVAVVHQGIQHYVEIVEDQVSRRGKDYFWIGGKMTPVHAADDTDVRAIKEGKITLVPLTWMQENHNEFEKIKNLT